MAAKSLCMIPDCCKPVFHRSWCAGHYHRWRRHGDPLGGRRVYGDESPFCMIEGCEKKRYGHGYCNAHYKRFKRHGDPHAGAAPHGAHMLFIRDIALNHSSPDCLPWPFGSIADQSYGVISVDGNQSSAHRYICEAVHGSPPEHFDAAHSCGNRACVNPLHISWKTRADNMADKLIHGTHHRGERAPAAILTEQQVREIRRLKKIKTQKELADEYGVARQTITNIHTGVRWAWMKP